MKNHFLSLTQDLVLGVATLPHAQKDVGAPTPLQFLGKIFRGTGWGEQCFGADSPRGGTGLILNAEQGHNKSARIRLRLQTWTT